MQLEEYNPFNITLYKHQRETMLFILQNKRCFVLDGIGTGKTLASLSAADFLMIHNKISKVLVVSPISVMRATWCDHILRFFPGRSFTVLYGPKAKRLANLDLDCSFYIINTDGIKIIENEIIKRNFDMIIVDESTSFASHKSDRTKAMWRIAKSIPSVIPMSGAPIANDTLQSFAQARLVTPGYPKYFTHFRDQLKIKVNMYSYLDKPGAIDMAYDILRPSIRHSMEECLDIPPITYKNVDIPLTKDQEKHYKLMEKEYITFLESGKSITAVNAGVKSNKLLQISAGLLIDENGEAIAVNHKYRLKELKEIIGQTSKVIVFASFTKSINSLLEELPGSEKIDGSVNERKRADRIDRFQNGDLNVLVCHPAAISHGVTLTASNTIVWFSPTWSNEAYIQCNGRIRRSGQKRPQLIIRFMSTDIEKRVYYALSKKQKVSDMLLKYAEIDTSDEQVPNDEELIELQRKHGITA